MSEQDLSFDDLVPKKKRSGVSFTDLIPGTAAPDTFMRGPAGAAEDTGVLQAVAVGAGRGFERLDSGIRQPFYELGAKMGFTQAGQKRDELAASDQEARRLYAPMQEAHPLASGIGETLPAFAVPVGGATSVLGAMGRMALPGAAQALLSYGSPEERLKDTALQGAGGAVGGGLTTLAGKLISPAVKAATPELRGMAQTAKAAGIKLNPAQLTGGKFAQGVQSALDTIPWTAGAQQAAKDTQQTAFNKAWLKLGLGVDAAKASPDVLTDAATVIGQKFTDGVTGVTIPLNATTKALIGSIKNSYAKRLDSLQKPIVANIADDLKAAGNAISGEQYHAFVSDIAQAARSVSDKKTQVALKSLRKSLDDAYTAAAPAEKAAAYFEARGQWKNLKIAEDALQNARSQGDIPAKQLYASTQKMTPNFVRGAGGELAELTRAGRQFLPDPIANSGTPFRTAFTNLLSAGTMGGAGAGVSALSGGDPMDGLKLGLLGYGASKGAQKIFNSRYPTNQLISEEMKRLLMRGGGLLGAGSAAGLSGN